MFRASFLLLIAKEYRIYLDERVTQFKNHPNPISRSKPKYIPVEAMLIKMGVGDNIKVVSEILESIVHFGNSML